jgi:hypothetical protein
MPNCIVWSCLTCYFSPRRLNTFVYPTPEPLYGAVPSKLRSTRIRGSVEAGSIEFDASCLKLECAYWS